MKIRPVDNFSWGAAGGRSKRKRKLGSINGNCSVPEKLKHDHLDSLAAGMALLWKCVFLPSQGEGACDGHV